MVHRGKGDKKRGDEVGIEGRGGRRDGAKEGQKREKGVHITTL